MKDFSVIPNKILDQSQLSIPARYLYCVLLRHCGSIDYCYPGQVTLGRELGICPRYVQTFIKELEINGLLSKKRTGYNSTNTYKLAKALIVDDAKPSSSTNTQPTIPHISSTFPLDEGTLVPPNNTYLISKDNNDINNAAKEKFRQSLIEKGIIKDKKVIIKSQ